MSDTEFDGNTTTIRSRDCATLYGIVSCNGHRQRRRVQIASLIPQIQHCTTKTAKGRAATNCYLSISRNLFNMILNGFASCKNLHLSIVNLFSKQAASGLGTGAEHTYAKCETEGSITSEDPQTYAVRIKSEIRHLIILKINSPSCGALLASSASQPLPSLQRQSR